MRKLSWDGRKRSNIFCNLELCSNLITKKLVAAFVVSTYLPMSSMSSKILVLVFAKAALYLLSVATPDSALMMTVMTY